MKSTVFTLIFRDIALPDALAAVKRAYDESETGMKPDASLWLKHQEKPVLDPMENGSVDSVIDAYNEAGVSATMYFAHDYPKDENSLQIAMKHVDAAAKIGAEESLLLCPWPYRGGLGKFIPPLEYYKEIVTFTEYIIPLADYAKDRNHRLSFKPHCGLVSDARSAWEFAARYNHPSMRICYDAANVKFYEGVDPKVSLDIAAPLISSLCLKDYRGNRWQGQFPDPGKGDVDHRGIMDMVVAAGFNGPVVVEKVEGESMDDRVTHLASVLRFVKSLSDKMQ